jgi:hypothetical protein
MAVNGPWTWQNPALTDTGLFGYAQSAPGGTQVIVGASGLVLRSTDGISWTNIRTLYSDYGNGAIDDGTDLDTVIYWNGRFIAGGNSHILTSTDGKTWKAAQVDLGGTALTVASFTVFGSKLVASTEPGVPLGSGPSFVSTDGIHWARGDGTAVVHAAAIGSTLYSVVYDSVPAHQQLYSSTDGKHWSVDASFPGSSVGAEMAASDGTTLLVVDITGNGYSTTDGSHWSAAHAAPAMQGLQWTGREFVVLSTGILYYTSADGSAWTSHALPARVTNLHWTGSQYLALGGDGALDTSPDGDAWTGVSTPGSEDFVTAIWDGSQFLLYGIGNDRYAGDGSSWTAQALTGTTPVQDVVKGDQVFLAADSTGEIQVSTDGLAWTNTGVDAAHGYFNLAQCGSKAVAIADVDASLQVWVATADAGSNFLTWSQSASDFDEPIALACGNGVFVAAFFGGSVAVSSDGVSWTTTQLHYKAGLPILTALKFFNGRFIATTDGSELYTSTRGAGWTELDPVTAQAPAGLAGLVWDGKEYIGTPSLAGSLWSSPDLSTWYEDVYVPGAIALGALGAGGGHALIAGDSSGILESTAGAGAAPIVSPVTLTVSTDSVTSTSGRCKATDPQHRALVYQADPASLRDFNGTVTVDSFTGDFTVTGISFDPKGDPLHFACRASNGYMISEGTASIGVAASGGKTPPPKSGTTSGGGGGEADLFSLLLLAWLLRRRQTPRAQA